MLTLDVEGMTCMGCVRTVEKVVGQADPAAKVAIDLASGKVTIDTAAERGVFVKAIETAGFDVRA
ncbi:MAG: heavy-metal-associated domain-containing protein [Hyphomicrobiaceae bacterium]|nr:heavy-metal-associated domain-containing protein [Hyphomicrobiaceae bacterium]